jgi:amino acid permease
MSSVGESGGRTMGRTIAAVIIAVIAILFIVAGFIYIAEPAKSLPSILGQTAHSTGHHPLRAAGCLVVGVVFAVGAWFALRYKPKPKASADLGKENTPAGHA